MTETQLQRAVKELLQDHNWMVVRVQSGMRKVGRTWIHFAPKGTADLLCCTPNGRFAAVEIKRPKKRRMPEQETFGRNVAGRNAISLVVRDLNSLALWLADHWEDWHDGVWTCPSRNGGATDNAQAGVRLPAEAGR